MAIPLLVPIIMAVAGLASGAVQGYSNAKNAKAEAKLIRQQERDQINERARQAIKLMNQQKTSYLKAGVYFDNGSAADVIDETYDVMNEDIASIRADSNTKVNNLIRQGRTAFASSLLGGAQQGAQSFFQTSGKSAK